MRLANKAYRQIHGLLIDVYSLPVAPLALPKCSSVFNVHTRPRAMWTTGAVTQNFYGFCFPRHRFRTVQVPFLTPFFLPLCRRFRTVHRATQTERKLYFDAYCRYTYNVYVHMYIVLQFCIHPYCIRTHTCTCTCILPVAM